MTAELNNPSMKQHHACANEIISFIEWGITSHLDNTNCATAKQLFFQLIVPLVWSPRQRFDNVSSLRSLNTLLWPGLPMAAGKGPAVSPLTHTHTRRAHSAVGQKGPRLHSQPTACLFFTPGMLTSNRLLAWTREWVRMCTPVCQVCYHPLRHGRVINVC